jgi:hypothetical protein
MQRLRALSAARHGEDQTSGPDRGVERDVPLGARGPARRLLQWALVALGVLTLMLVRYGLDADEHTSLRVLRVAPSARWDGPALNRSAHSRSGLPDDIAGRLDKAGPYGAFDGQKLHTLPPSLAKTPPASVARTLPPSVARTLPPSVAALKPPVLPRAGGRCHTFRVGNRADFLLVLAPIFVELGMCPSESSSFDVYWGISLNSIESFASSKLGPNMVPANAILNSMPLMMQAVGEKPSIASLQSACHRYVVKGCAAGRANQLHEPGWCEFTQRGFNARRELEFSPVTVEFDALRDYVNKKKGATGRFPSFWIRKSIISYSQKGIRLMHLSESDVGSDGALIKWVEERMPAGDYTLQEYLAAPMLWNDRKFDMRALALMTSVQPLRFYTLDHAYPKIATSIYTTDLSSLDDSCVHFRMVVCGEPVNPYPPSTDVPLFQDNLRPRLKSDTHWDEELYPAVYKVLLRVVLLARREVRAPPSILDSPGQDSHIFLLSPHLFPPCPAQVIPADEKLVRAGFKHKRVQVLQPDVIFDREGNAYVIEMNTNGFMVGALHKDFFDATLPIRSATEIAGVNKCAPLYKIPPADAAPASTHSRDPRPAPLSPA